MTLILRTTLGKHAHVRPLVEGRVRSNRIAFECIDVEPLPKAFRQMVRGADVDVSEMAVVTHLLAHRYEKPLTGLAIPLWSRLPHTNLVTTAEGEIIGPRDLENRKVGVRAYGQTSGVWVRGVLETEYGVDLDSITWVTMEDAHLSEYEDPQGTVRNTSGKGLRELMLAGELAAIMGERVVDPSGIRTVIPEAEEAGRDWVARKGLFPINHVVVVRDALLAEHGWLAGELMELFTEARRIAIAEGAEAPPEYGIEANRASLQLAFDFSYRQRITARRYEVDELFVKL